MNDSKHQPRTIDSDELRRNQLADYRRAAILCWNVAGYRAARLSQEEAAALYTTHALLRRLADEDAAVFEELYGMVKP